MIGRKTIILATLLGLRAFRERMLCEQAEMPGKTGGLEK